MFSVLLDLGFVPVELPALVVDSFSVSLYVPKCLPILFRCDYASLLEGVRRSIRLSVLPSIHPSIRLSGGLFRVLFERQKSLFLRVKSQYDSMNKETMSDDEVATSDVPPRQWFSQEIAFLSYITRLFVNRRTDLSEKCYL